MKSEDIDLSTPDIDFEGILKREDQRFQDLRKIQPFDDERASKLFKELERLYSEAEWFGRSIRFPGLKVGTRITPDCCESTLSPRKRRG